MSSQQREVDRLLVMASLAGQAALEPVAPEVDRQGRDRIVAALAAARSRRPRVRKGTVSVLALAAVLVAGWALWVLRPRPLRYEVVGGSGLPGSYVSAPPTAPIDLRFSDGSDVHAEAGSRLRVDAISTHGARVLLEKGAAISHVAHHKASSWTFVAGPFEVRVIGTRFDLSWDPLAEEFDLMLREGSVEVRSPLADGPIVVRAGQRFRAALNHRTMTVTDGESAAQPVAAAPESATQPVAAAPEPATTAAPAPKPAARRESWQELLAHGEFESIVTSATLRGLEGCVQGCSASDLRSLADAARYTSRIELADKCLLALRRRFPGSTQSMAAAFLLGRTHEGQSPGTAARWYETYLSESSGGEFAAEALAGKMRAVAAERGPWAAKPLALEYLRRYPLGVQVKTARKIAGLD